MSQSPSRTGDEAAVPRTRRSGSVTIRWVERAQLEGRLSCVECGNTWELGFEPDEFLWREVAASALRLLRQVHVLARAYGWGESDVLALGPQRREAYLTLVGSA